MGKFVDLTGKKFEQLTVVRQKHSKNGNRIWECKCFCGNFVNIITKELNNGKRVCCKKCSKNRCFICGLTSKNKKICSDKCQKRFNKLSKNPPSFYSYKHAAKYLKNDQRTIKKWETYSIK